ncbi:MAG TPA: UTP--glucose-1-phosphate uridylyltransferase [Chondromyces sp.]|nr:UTP--glucose-1-phosphate uridylyltransferase [Chondromyces sp.]
MADLRAGKDEASPFVERMERAGIPEAAIASFRYHLARLVDGDRGTLSEDAIRPLDEIADAASLQSFRGAGSEALRRVAVLKLNGGLGTSMGLERAKSLLEVRDGLTFLDLIARQILALRVEVGAEVPLLLMDSFRTADDARRVLSRYPDLERDDLPLSFLQHRAPKVDAETLLPASHPAEAELEWCPPGHGDLYTALATSGVLELLLDAGLEYAFVSNADNLGAVLDAELLGYMVAEGLDFMLEAADRTAADRKGGHLCRLANGRLALRESAQCPPGSEAAFQDIGRYRYFNTNNVWLSLPALARALAEHGGFLPLPTLVNRKTVDPRDPSSPAVFQLETAMGSAISFFERAAAVRVPRRRFSPVKNTDDLLAARSDAYELSDDWLVRLHADREAPPAIRLDPAHFKLIDAFEERFPHGPPSLRRCRSLQVEGDITFGARIIVEGDVVVRADEATAIPDDTTLTGTCVF